MWSPNSITTSGCGTCASTPYSLSGDQAPIGNPVGDLAEGLASDVLDCHLDLVDVVPLELGHPVSQFRPLDFVIAGERRRERIVDRRDRERLDNFDVVSVERNGGVLHPTHVTVMEAEDVVTLPPP